MPALLDRSPLPSRFALRNVLEDTIGCAVGLTDGEPVAAKSTNLIAVYVTDRLAVSALIVINLEGAARLGGALAMLPRPSVNEALVARELSPLLVSRCEELFAAVATVFNGPSAPAVRLYRTYGPEDVLPPDVAALSAALGSRLDVQLSIDGYGSGQCSVVVR